MVSRAKTGDNDKAGEVKREGGKEWEDSYPERARERESELAREKRNISLEELDEIEKALAQSVCREFSPNSALGRGTEEKAAYNARRNERFDERNESGVDAIIGRANEPASDYG